MELKFKNKTLENIVVVSQFSANGEQKLANIDIKKRKVNLINKYRRQLDRDNIPLKEVCEIILNNYDAWLLQSSPLRNMTEDQKHSLLEDMRAFNILAICIQDRIDNLSFLNSLDQFGEVTGDMQSLQDAILSFTRKISSIVGIDKAIELGDVADKIENVLTEKH